MAQEVMDPLLKACVKNTAKGGILQLLVKGNRGRFMCKMWNCTWLQDMDKELFLLMSKLYIKKISVSL